MGLIFTHCDRRMSYGGFHAFREDLAKQAGIHLSRRVAQQRHKGLGGLDDPISLLFTQQDEYGGGELTPEQCSSLKGRVRELADQWDGEKSHRPHKWKAFAEEFANGLAKAAFLGEPFAWY
jgi:hypothetical protein